MDAVSYVFELLLPGVKDYWEENTKGEEVIDLHLGFQLGKNNKLSFFVKNVMNNECQLRPALMEAPKNFTLRNSHNF